MNLRRGLPCIRCGTAVFDADAHFQIAGVALNAFPCVKCGEPGDVWASEDLFLHLTGQAREGESVDHPDKCGQCRASQWEPRRYTAGGEGYTAFVCGNCGHAPLTPPRLETAPVDWVQLQRGIPLSVKAQEFATVAHRGQEYGRTGKPYTHHLQVVVRMLQSRYPDDDELHAMGWLHDSVEDDKLTIGLIEREFGPRIARGVWLVTRPENEPYPLYVATAISEYDPCRVKWANMEHNSRGKTDHPKYGPFLPVVRKAVVTHEAALREEQREEA